MLAFVFPGQGSQRPAMGEPWRDHRSWHLVEAASEVAGRDLAHLLLAADATELRATRNAQLATFVVAAMALEAATAAGIEPAVVAGHSLGEYVALHAAGVIPFPDAVALVAERAEAMQIAAETHPGTMAAVIGPDAAATAGICADVRGPGRDDGPRRVGVWLANDNAPGQSVVAGTQDAIDAVARTALDRGARTVIPLDVGGAFHTPLMAPAVDRLRHAVDAAPLRDARLDVIANVDGRAHRGADTWRTLLVSQLCDPVRWRPSLGEIAAAGATHVIELGPGTALRSTVKRTVPELRYRSVGRPADLDGLVAEADRTPDAPPEGEPLHTGERLVVSPVAGRFTPDPGLSPGRRVHAGGDVGRVGDTVVRTPFAGVVAGVLAQPGERLTRSQPVAWLRPGP